VSRAADAPLRDEVVASLDPGTEERIRKSIGRQTLLTTLGVTIAELASGRVVLDLPYRADLCQQTMASAAIRRFQVRATARTAET
jgi:hypothetical protein